MRHYQGDPWRAPVAQDAERDRPGDVRLARVGGLVAGGRGRVPWPDSQGDPRGAPRAQDAERLRAGDVGLARVGGLVAPGRAARRPAGRVEVGDREAARVGVGELALVGLDDVAAALLA